MNAADARHHADAIIAAARAVAAPGTPVLLLVDRAGHKARAGWEDLENLERLAATDPDRLCRLPFAVTVADHVLAIDCDTGEAADAAHQIARWCTDAGATPVLARSGRPGHLHLWCVTNNPALHRACVRHAARAGADVRTGKYMRPPGAAHTTSTDTHIDGGLPAAIDALAVTVLPGGEISAADTDEQRRAGTADRNGHPPRTAPRAAAPSNPTKASPAPATNEIAQRAAGRLAASTLTSTTLELLRNGDGGGDRSVTLQRILVGMVNRGWGIDSAWDALMVRRHHGAEKLHDRYDRYGPDAAWAYLTHSWDRAVAWVTAHPPQGCDEHTAATIDRFAAEADTHHWAGEAGASAWMVLHTLCIIGRRGPGLTLGASERELAERSALSRTTVHNALEHLMATGWITRVEVGRGPRASVWRLETSEASRELRDAARRSLPLPHPPPHTSSGGCVENGLAVRAGSDAFRRGALGANGYRVLRALLLEGAATTTRLAERLGLHRGSVARVLNRCAEAGLASRHDDGTWTLTTHHSGTNGVADAPEPSQDADAPEAEQGGPLPAGVDPATGEIVAPADVGAVGGRRTVVAAPLVFDPSALGAVALKWRTVGTRARARALHAAEREEYARSAAYAAATAPMRRAA